MAVFILAVITSVIAPNAYERLAALSTGYKSGPLAGLLEPSDIIISEYCSLYMLFMRTDLFIVKGEDLVEKLRLQLRVEERDDAVSHFFDMNGPEITTIVNTLFRRDLYQVLRVVSMPEKLLFVPVVKPLRDLLSEYVENRASFPFYDFLPQALRESYIRYFTPIPSEKFPVRLGAPGSGVVAYIPKCSDRYEDCEKCQPDSDDEYSSDAMGTLNLNGRKLIALCGKEKYPTRVINMEDGRSADYNGPGSLVFDTDHRKVISCIGSMETIYRENGSYRELCSKRMRPSSAAIVARNGELVVLDREYTRVLRDSNEAIPRLTDPLAALEAKDARTGEQTDLLKYVNHMKRREYESCVALVSNLGFDMDAVYDDDYIKVSIQEIIEDGSISGRLSKRARREE